MGKCSPRRAPARQLAVLKPTRAGNVRRAAAITIAAAMGALGLATAPIAAPASAATYEVTSGADSGPGTLREAIESIDPSDPDPVVTIIGGLKILLEADIDIPDVLTVRGVEGDLPIITFDPEEGGNPGTVFSHQGESVTFVGEHFAVHGLPEEDEEDWDRWSEVLQAGDAAEAQVTFRGVEAVGLDTLVDVWRAPSANVVIEGSSFAEIGSFRDGEGSFVDLANDFGGSFTVRDSSFERMWLHLAWPELGSGTIVIERSQFISPPLTSWESEAGVLAVELTGGADPGTVPVVIRDSFFSGGGADVAGVLTLDTSGEPVGTPVAAEITGSTFVNTLAGEEAANVLVMDIDDPATSVVFQNSTFALPATSVEYREMEAVVRQEGSNAARLVMEHVTSVGPGVSAEEPPVVTLRDSAFVTEATGIVYGTDDAWIIEEGDELPELDLSQVVIERTLVSEPGPRFPDLPATPAAEFLLGELAANGGPTQTMLPGPGSKLLDAAGGELIVDQRGLPRPVGSASDAGAVEVQTATVALVEDVTVPEGEPLEFVVTREGGEPGYPASVDYATADGTAVAPSNYAATNGSLEWAGDDTEPKRITVESVRDGVVTGPLQFTVALTGPGGGTTILADSGTRTGTLTNVDEEGEVIPPSPDPDPEPKPTPTPTPTPPVPPSQGDGLAQTGASSAGWIWGIGALGVAGGALLLSHGLRRRNAGA